MLTCKDWKHHCGSHVRVAAWEGQAVRGVFYQLHLLEFTREMGQCLLVIPISKSTIGMNVLNC